MRESVRFEGQIKSVTKNLHTAHDKAVNEALRYIEDHATYVRITKDGKTKKLLQKNLTIAMFRHDTYRALDPIIIIRILK